MNEVIELLGLSRLLSTMNPVQLKHLRSYMELFDQENKSAKLFSFLCQPIKSQNHEEISKKLGYTSKGSPAFRKLIQRFSTKVYDYLLTDHAISFGNPYNHTQEKNEALKKNLQAFMLLELDNPNKGLEIVDDVVSSSIKNELFAEAKEALYLKKKLLKKLGRTFNSTQLESQINRCVVEREQVRRLTNAIMAFNLGECTDKQHKLILSDIKRLKNWDSYILKSTEISKVIAKTKKLQIQGKYAAAYEQSVQLYHLIRKSSSLESSISEYSKCLLIENLMITGRDQELNQVIQFYSYHSKLPARDTHHQFVLIFYHALFSKNKELAYIFLKKLTNAEYLTNDHSVSFRIHYYVSLYEFVFGDPRTFVEIVGIHFKKIGGPDSLCALFLRAMELVCFYQREKLELLEYKIRNYIKGVNRFNQKHPTENLKQISQFFGLLLRKDYDLQVEHLTEIQHANSWINNDLDIRKIHNPSVFLIAQWAMSTFNLNGHSAQAIKTTYEN